MHPHPLAAPLAATALLHIALLISPARLAHGHLAALFLPLICSCHAYSWTRGAGAFAGVHALWAVELLLWRRPREEFWLRRRDAPSVASGGDDGKNGGGGDKRRDGEAGKEPYPEALGARFCWVLKLVASSRFIGWDAGCGSEGKGRPDISVLSESAAGKEQALSRSSWLLRKCLSAILCCLLIDATNSYQAFDPYFLGQTDDIDAPFRHPLAQALAANSFGRTHGLLSSLPPRLLRIAGFGAQQYAVFQLLGTLSALAFVSLGGLGLVDDFWGGMQNWRPLMGSPLAVCRRGLKGFWGGFWHQLFRYVGTT
jgi:hypothetical protein